jgi:hypothetical protein
MSYVHSQSVAKSNTNMKVVGATLVAFALALAMSIFVAASANAHEVVSVVNEGKPNCYGKVASMHAKEGGLKASYENWDHVGIGLTPDTTFQEEAAAIKAACRE